MKYLAGFIISIGLIVLVFFLVLRGLRSDTPTDQKQVTLGDYANTEASVRFTLDGPIVADQEHRAYRITVSRSEAVLETFRGYDYNLIDRRAFANTQSGYDSFLKALERAGFTQSDPKAPKDERGACAMGRRYILEVQNGSSQLQRSWTTSCKEQGSFTGSIDAVRTLFINQIPRADFTKLTNSLRV